MSERISQDVSLATNLKWKLLSPLAGSSSPRYVQLDWKVLPFEQIESSGRELVFEHTVSANRVRNPFPRGWREAGVLAVDAKQLDGFKGWFSTGGAQEAVACLRGRKVIYGVLPQEVSFTPLPEPNDDMVGIAMRLGPGVLSAAAGLYDKNRGFMQPPAVRFIDEIAINELPQKYPGVHLV